MEIANIHEAKSRLSKLIEHAMRGEEVIIAKAGQPMVRLVPVMLVMPRVPAACCRTSAGAGFHGRGRLRSDWRVRADRAASRAAGWGGSMRTGRWTRASIPARVSP